MSEPEFPLPPGAGAEARLDGGTSRARFIGFAVLVIAALVLFDLWSKAHIFDWLGWPGDYNSVEGLERTTHGGMRLPLFGTTWFAWMPSLNYGAAWGMFGEYPHILVYGRMAAVILMAYLLVRSRPDQHFLRLALILVTAGALGNLHDNLLIEVPGGNGPDRPFGPVRDFIDVYFPRWDWHFPIFNVADSCITVGAALLLLSGFFGSREPAQASEEHDEESEREAGAAA